jgi:hypothetical protein
MFPVLFLDQLLYSLVQLLCNRSVRLLEVSRRMPAKSRSRVNVLANKAAFKQHQNDTGADLWSLLGQDFRKLAASSGNSAGTSVSHAASVASAVASSLTRQPGASAGHHHHPSHGQGHHHHGHNQGNRVRTNSKGGGTGSFSLAGTAGAAVAAAPGACWTDASMVKGELLLRLALQAARCAHPAQHYPQYAPYAPYAPTMSLPLSPSLCLPQLHEDAWEALALLLTWVRRRGALPAAMALIGNDFSLSSTYQDGTSDDAAAAEGTEEGEGGEERGRDVPRARSRTRSSDA